MVQTVVAAEAGEGRYGEGARGRGLGDNQAMWEEKDALEYAGGVVEGGKRGDR